MPIFNKTLWQCHAGKIFLYISVCLYGSIYIYVCVCIGQLASPIHKGRPGGFEGCHYNVGAELLKKGIRKCAFLIYSVELYMEIFSVGRVALVSFS